MNKTKLMNLCFILSTKTMHITNICVYRSSDKSYVASNSQIRPALGFPKEVTCKGKDGIKVRFYVVEAANKAFCDDAASRRRKRQADNTECK